MNASIRHNNYIMFVRPARVLTRDPESDCLRGGGSRSIRYIYKQYNIGKVVRVQVNKTLHVIIIDRKREKLK
jgi:hypothetical protein